jgi:hypothetical protein
MENLWTNYFFPFLTIIGLLYLYFTLKNLLPSYFSEKGKNIATKEDVSEITDLVETVKHSFATETEKLKANLLVLSNIQVGLVAEERNAIIDYNEKYFKWLNILIDLGLGDGDHDDNDDLSKHQQALGEYYKVFLNSETKFKLFVENQEIIDFSNKMKIETLKELGNFAPSCLINLKHNNIKIELMRKVTPPEEQSSKYQELIDEKKSIHDDFRVKMIEGYRKIAPLNRQFQKICREHIYQLLVKQENSLP